MKVFATPKIFLLIISTLYSFSRADAQSTKWERNAKGRLYPVKTPAVKGFKVHSVYDLIHQMPVIANPKGFDVQEWFHTTKGEVYAAHLYINFYYYYRYEGGSVQRANAHVPTVTFGINDPKDLMDDQTVLFREQTDALKMPVMFTDTFPLTYKITNGYLTGHGINTRFGNNSKFLVLNPRNIRFFRPVTMEEYIRVFIGKMNADIEEQSNGLLESRKSLEEMGKNPAFKNSMADLQNLQNAMIKWVDFQKSKKQSFEKKLAAMTEQEKKAPAYYAMYKNSAVMKDKNGNYLETISGHLLYEPLLDARDTIATKPLFTFAKKIFDPASASTAFQFMVIEDAFSFDSRGELKDYLDSEFFPALPLKELAALIAD